MCVCVHPLHQYSAAAAEEGARPGSFLVAPLGGYPIGGFPLVKMGYTLIFYGKMRIFYGKMMTFYNSTISR